MNSSDILEHLTLVAPFISLPVYWTDLEARLLGANQACLSMWQVKNKAGVRGRLPKELYSKELASGVLEQINLVISSRAMHASEESFPDAASGRTRYYTAVRAPIIGADGKMVGVFGTAFDITEKKEAERSSLNNVTEEQLTALSNRVAHALSSPLTALKMLGSILQDLPEQQQQALTKAIDRIDEVVCQLQNRSGPKPLIADANAVIERREPHLLSGLITQFAREQQLHFQNRQVIIRSAIADNAQFAFAHIQPRELKAAMAHLVKNAVDAVEARESGCVMVKLEARADVVTVFIQDNGKGMNFELLTTMLERQSFNEETEGNSGMPQVWDMLEKNKGKLNVDTILGEGTSIQLIFPRIEVADWIAQKIQFAVDSIIVVLDPDEAVHRAWMSRLDIYRKLYPGLQLHQFRQGQPALDCMRSFSAEEQQRLVFLSAVELQHPAMNGLQIVELAKIKNATLVTGFYADPVLQKAAGNSGAKILPKEMLPIIPIYFES